MGNLIIDEKYNETNTYEVEKMVDRYKILRTRAKNDLETGYLGSAKINIDAMIIIENKLKEKGVTICG